VRRSLPIILAVAACLAIGACEADNNPANPTPASISTTLEIFGQQGVLLANVVSGDPGCADQELAHTAVSMSASGFDQATPTRLYLYAFRNRATWERLASTVDACVRSYVTSASAFGSIQTSPYVLAGPGPWAPDFAQHLRAALTKAAGNGG
jgi:hypothetical protein